MQSGCKPYTQDNHWSSNKNQKRLAQKISKTNYIKNKKIFSAKQTKQTYQWTHSQHEKISETNR